jgi:DNA ligase-associated metallophosphoesterase
VPETTTAATLARLGALVDRLRAQRLIVLGDLLHGPAARAPALIDALAAWRHARPALAVTLVRGNHDARAGDPPPGCGIELADEPTLLGALSLHHEPPAAVPEGRFALAGHLHPACRLHDGLGGLRLPCFWLRSRQLILPAFGDFTGGHPVTPAAGDRLYPVADGRVFALPPAGSAPRRPARARRRGS